MDYFAREELTIRNAIPTAEGCLGILLRQRKRTLWGSGVLVTGFGPVGQALGPRLAALGADVTIAARRPAQRARHKDQPKRREQAARPKIALLARDPRVEVGEELERRAVVPSAQDEKAPDVHDRLDAQLGKATHIVVPLPVAGLVEVLHTVAVLIRRSTAIAEGKPARALELPALGGEAVELPLHFFRIERIDRSAPGLFHIVNRRLLSRQVYS